MNKLIGTLVVLGCIAAGVGMIAHMRDSGFFDFKGYGFGAVVAVATIIAATHFEKFKKWM